MSIAKIVRGTAFIGFVNVLRLIVQFVSVPVLARLLSPVDYGLAAMAMPVILFVMLLADAGLGNSLVRTSRTNDPAWHMCFWLSVGLGIVGAAGVALLSPLVAFFLSEPRLTPMLATLAAIIPLQTFTMVPGACLQKEARFGTIAATEIVAMCTSLGAAVALAIAGSGVWALVWQQIVFYAVRLTLTLTCSPYRPRLMFDLHDAWEHVIFGRNLLGMSLISSASRSLENLVIGKVNGAGPVGVYAMAFQFARLPFMLVTGPLQYSLYPHVAAIREDRAQLTALFVLLTRVLAMVLLPAVGLVAVASEPTFTLLLSHKWVHAAPVFALIAPAAALQPVTAIVGTFLMALGRTDVQIRLAAQFAVVWIAGLTMSVWYGLEAVAMTYSVCALLFSAWSLRICLPLLDCSFASYARLFMWPMALTVVAMIGYRVLSSPEADHNALNVGIAMTLALIVTVIALLVQRRALVAALTMSAANSPHSV
ncbi:MAG: lipopolysaccharide biosynthesis protein [Planctomycetes bacterium]|nr:lipopolysaccharide biosynthesis protein [Planctomycetota bacterium]